MRRSPSIRAMLLLTVGLLAALIATMALRDMHQHWQQLQNIRTLKEATAVNASFFNVIEHLSRERELTFALLKSSDKTMVGNLQQRLSVRRAEADAGLEKVFAALERHPLPALASPLRELKYEFAELQVLRQRTDQALSLPLKEREAVLASRMFNYTTMFLSDTYNLWLGYTRHFTEIDPVVTQRLMFQHFLGLIIRYSGRERALIGGLIVSNQPVTVKNQMLLLQWRGVIEQGWEMCSRLSERSRLAPDIIPYLWDAQSHYLTVYDMVQDLFYTPGGPPVTTYPIDIEQWLELSSSSNDSLNALKDAALKQTQVFVQQLETDAQHTIFVNLLLLALALLLCSASFYVVQCRVIYPIQQMINALLDAAAGKAPKPLPLSTREDDEIGKLARVLEAFQESSARYRTLIEASSQIIWVWKEGNLDGMSPLGRWWEATTGQPADAITTFGWLEVVHPDDRNRVQTTWKDALAHHKSFEMDYRLRTREGDYRYVTIRGVPLLAADGSLSEFIGSLNDVTARKKAEADLRRYTKDLERSNKELDDFAYIASHDLKEPLRGIHNHSRFLLEDNEGKLEKDSVDRMHRLLYLSQRMEKLVNDLLYFSRLGRQELAIQPTDMNMVVHDIETMIDVFLHEHNAKVVIPEPLPTVTCDKPRVTEALRNLITNAVKYNDKQEKIVEVGFLKQVLLPDGTEARNAFFVKDNGVGIPLEFHTEVFRIFKRLQSTKDKREDGTGVGLTFVKKIIERHGGKIWLESELGQGTTFYFTLGRAAYDS